MTMKELDERENCPLLLRTSVRIEPRENGGRRSRDADWRLVMPGQALAGALVEAKVARPPGVSLGHAAPYGVAMFLRLPVEALSTRKGFQRVAPRSLADVDILVAPERVVAGPNEHRDASAYEGEERVDVQGGGHFDKLQQSGEEGWGRAEVGVFKPVSQLSRGVEARLMRLSPF